MIIGVQGKIASGKSEVMKILGRRGFFCVDADEITHNSYKKNARATKLIEKEFGHDFLSVSGEVDRVRLRNMVFNDDEALKKINSLIHPFIFSELKSLIQEKSHEKVAIESAYFDSELLSKLDKLLWVQRSKSEIIRSLRARKFDDCLAEKAFSLISKSSNSRVIEVRNEGSLQELENEVERALKLL